MPTPLPDILFPGENANYENVARYLAKHYVNDGNEIIRKREARARIDIYSGRIAPYLKSAIGALHTHQDNYRELISYIPYVRYEGLARRIIQESATLYREPAVRRVAGEQNNQAYQRALEETNFHAWRKLLNDYVILLNTVAQWVYTRYIDDTPELVVEILTPDMFSPVSHPRHPRKHVATIIEQFPGREAPERAPHYLVYGDAEIFWLDKNGKLASQISPNPYGRQPLTLVSKDIAPQGLLNPEAGADLAAAELTLSYLQLRLMKDQKSGGKFPAIIGEADEKMTRGQPLNAERFLIFPPETTLQVLDLKADADTINKAIVDIRRTVAASYGHNIEFLNRTYQAQNAEQETIQRQPQINNLRAQRIWASKAEREAMELMANITAIEVPRLAFDPTGWRVDFADWRLPDTPDKELARFQVEKEAGLTTTIEFLQKRNPDLTPEQAKALWVENVTTEASLDSLRQSLRESLQAPQNSPAQVPPEDDNAA